MISVKFPLWLRLVLLAGVAILASGAGLMAYRYYTHPVTLAVAVGSIDGEAAKAMSAIASKLVTINAPVRLTVVDTGTALAAAKTFAAGKGQPIYVEFVFNFLENFTGVSTDAATRPNHRQWSPIAM